MTSKKRKKSRGRARRRQRRGINPLHVLIPIALVVLMVGGWLLASPGILSGTDEVPQFPTWLQRMSPKVRRAYAQAVAHWEDLQYIPCYCGCGSMGHTAVVDCHIADIAADGSMIFEQHAST